jgi:hypothetical protein
MLPNILDIALKHKLSLSNRTLHKEEVLCKCPFCNEDSKPEKKGKHYLSLNTKDQVFKCWYCGESGGVFRFMALLEGVTEEEVRSRYRKQRVSHPAERLTRRQRELMGFYVEPDWDAMKKRDYAYYLRTMDHIWDQWKEYVDSQVREAYFLLLLGIRFYKYSTYIEEIRKLEKSIEAPLLNRVLQIYSSPQRPKWTESIEAFVQFKPVSPEPDGQAGKKEKVSC